MQVLSYLLLYGTIICTTVWDNPCVATLQTWHCCKWNHGLAGRWELWNYLLSLKQQCQLPEHGQALSRRDDDSQESLHGSAVGVTSLSRPATGGEELVMVESLSGDLWWEWLSLADLLQEAEELVMAESVWGSTVGVTSLSWPATRSREADDGRESVRGSAFGPATWWRGRAAFISLLWFFFSCANDEVFYFGSVPFSLLYTFKFLFYVNDIIDNYLHALKIFLIIWPVSVMYLSVCVRFLLIFKCTAVDVWQLYTVSGNLHGEVVQPWLCVPEVVGTHLGHNILFTGAFLSRSLGIIAGATEFVPWAVFSAESLILCWERPST